jgi:hypothetical protein
MTMTARLKNKLVDTINTTFSAIGVSPNTRPPKIPKSNTAPSAWELFIANHLYTMASARRKKAREQAILTGVLFDHEKEPREPGTDEIVYEDEHVVVTLTVNNPATRINSEMLLTYLEGKVDASILKAATNYATFQTRPAYEFRAIVRTE